MAMLMIMMMAVLLMMAMMWSWRHGDDEVMFRHVFYVSKYVS